MDLNQQTTNFTSEILPENTKEYDIAFKIIVIGDAGNIVAFSHLVYLF